MHPGQGLYLSAPYTEYPFAPLVAELVQSVYNWKKK